VNGVDAVREIVRIWLAALKLKMEVSKAIGGNGDLPAGFFSAERPKSWMSAIATSSRQS
jgi:hypothetical protein